MSAPFTVWISSCVVFMSSLSLSSLRVKCQWPANINKGTNGNHRGRCLMIWVWSYGEPPIVCPQGVFVCGAWGAQMPTGPPGVSVSEKWTPCDQWELWYASLAHCYATWRGSNLEVLELMLTLYSSILPPVKHTAPTESGIIMWCSEIITHTVFIENYTFCDAIYCTTHMCRQLLFLQSGILWKNPKKRFCMNAYSSEAKQKATKCKDLWERQSWKNWCFE